MKLLDIRENAITAELDWGDVKLLTFLCNHAIEDDALSKAHDWSMASGFAEAMVACLEAAGMASYASFAGADTDEYTLANFRASVPLTEEERRRWERQCREAKREAPTAAD